MNPISCDAIYPMHFLSWEDNRNHYFGVCVESAAKAVCDISRYDHVSLQHLAYCEKFFLEKQWTEKEKEDSLQIMKCYA